MPESIYGVEIPDWLAIWEGQPIPASAYPLDEYVPSDSVFSTVSPSVGQVAQGTYQTMGAAATAQPTSNGTANSNTMALVPYAGQITTWVTSGFIAKAIAFIIAFVGKAGFLKTITYLFTAGLIAKSVYDVLKREGGKKIRGKRKSIGRNPRLKTLLSVAKTVDNLFLSYDKRVSKFRRRVKGVQRVARAARNVYYAGRNAKRDITLVR